MTDATDRAIAAVANRHGGHVSRRQLHRLGLSDAEIDYRIAIGRLIPVYRGIYAVGHVPGHPHDRARGALLAAGPRAALSHGSAAALWGHPGARALRPVFAELHPEPSRSLWELDWDDFAAVHELPPYDTNVVVGGHRVDVLFADAPIAVELDGWDTHRTKPAYEHDRLLANDVFERDGVFVTGLTQDRLRHHGAREADRLKRIVARHRGA